MDILGGDDHSAKIYAQIGQASGEGNGGMVTQHGDQSNGYTGKSKKHTTPKNTLAPQYGLSVNLPNSQYNKTRG